MNKKEAIELVKNTLYSVPINDSVKYIDEPKKPVVAQYVADWYEEHKDNFEIYLSELCINFTLNRERLDDKLANWYEQLENKPIQTLVNMHQFGYEVKKEIERVQNEEKNERNVNS